MKLIATISLLFFISTLSAQDFEGRFINNIAPRGLVIVDLDDDGDQDMIGTASTKILSWTNDGAGNFTLDTLANFFFQVYGGTYEDFNGDGIKEVYFINESQRKFLRFDGPELMVTLPTFSSGSAPPRGRTQVVDFDQDGDLDMVYTSNSESLVAWLENTGDFVFTNHIIDDNFANSADIAVGDINDDNELEIVVSANTNTAGVNLVYYYKSGNTYIQEQIDSPNHANIDDIKIADLNEDGKNDLFTISYGFNEEVRYWLNQGESTNPTFTPTTVMDDLDDGYSLTQADLDGDGDTDWIVSSGNSTLYWLEKSSTSPLEYNRRIVSLNDAHFYTRVGDLDGDGALDIIGSQQDNILEYYANLIPQVPNNVFSPTVDSKELVLYPTITENSLRVSLDLGSTTATISLYDMAGKHLENITLVGYESMVDVSKYTAGTYLLTGYIDGIRYHGKFIKK